MPARTRFLVPPVLAAAMFLAACGSDDGTIAAVSSTPAEATTSESGEADPCASTEGGPGTAVTVSERPFSPIQLDATSVEAGPTTFTVTNQGPGAHDLVVLGTDLAPNKLPLTDDGVAVDEKAAGVTLVGKTDFINVGCAASLTVDLEKGDYVLICNLSGPPGSPGHYESGMVSPTFTVT